MGADPHDYGQLSNRSSDMDDDMDEDAALALLGVSRGFLQGDLKPQSVMGHPPAGRDQGYNGEQPQATRHSSRRPKPVKKHKNDIGGFEKKEYQQFSYVGGRGRGRGSGRGPGRPPKGSFNEFGGRGAGMPPGYGYYAPPMQPQYAPEYTPEYAPQYPPRYAPQYAPPPALPTYSGDPPPGPPPQGWMPHRPVMMPQHQMPADPRPTIHQQPPIQPIQPLGAPHLPAGIPGPVVKDIRWMQRHLDDAVGIIGRKAGEPAEFDTIGSDWRLANGYDPELAKRTVVDLSDYTQEQLQDMADQTIQEECLPPVIRPRPGVLVSRTASYTGSDAFYSGKLYVGASGKLSSNPGAASGSVHARTTSNSGFDMGPTDDPKAGIERAPPSALHHEPVSGTSLARNIAAIWQHDNNAVWRLLGLGEPPVVERTSINYLRLILVVESVGGYRRATEQQLWPDVASKFGQHADQEAKQRAGQALRMLYLQYIFPVRSELQPYLPMNMESEPAR